MALTSAEIIAMACTIAKCPAYATPAGASLAGSCFKLVLQDLPQTYDFDIARGTYTFNFNASASQNGYALPSDFLRCAKDDFFYYVDNVPYTLVNVSLAEYDQQIKSSGLAGYPAQFATDMSQTPPVVYFYPLPAGNYPLTLRYYRQMPDIANAETSAVVPWFQNSKYLVTAVAMELMKITNDDRIGAFKMEAEDILRKFLEMKDDPEGRVNRVTLDRRTFGQGGSRFKSSKLTGF